MSRLIESRMRELRKALEKKLRKCDTCKKEILARQADQRFCSAACRDKWHAQNPDDKRRRREWAKANYWKNVREGK